MLSLCSPTILCAAPFLDSTFLSSFILSLALSCLLFLFFFYLCILSTTILALQVLMSRLYDMNFTGLVSALFLYHGVLSEPSTMLRKTVLTLTSLSQGHLKDEWKVWGSSRVPVQFLLLWHSRCLYDSAKRVQYEMLVIDKEHNSWKPQLPYL